MTNDKCISNIVNITNACIKLRYWPLYFERLILIIILKPNKLVYDSPKNFCPIFLLNTLSKLV